MDAKLFNDGSVLIQDLGGRLHYWLAWCDGLPVGYFVAEERKDGVIVIQRVGVLKAWRGHGLQKRMTKKHEMYFGKGVLYITYAHPDSVASINSLISSGYKTYKPKEKYGGKGMVYFFKQT